jgi:hypothetical protein
MAIKQQRAFRLPEDVNEVLSKVKNSTQYVVDAIREKAERERQAEIEASLACLANDSEDFSELSASQAKVISRGD